MPRGLPRLLPLLLLLAHRASLPPQAIRASSAAPYYLDDFLCGEDRFQDGAATANNPAVIALQQVRPHASIT